MQTNDNTAAQLLLFPVQLVSYEELETISDPYPHFFNTRMRLIARANLFATGYHVPCFQDYQKFRDFNQVSRKYGFSELPIDF